MAKTRRLIKENLSNVDIVLELLDARIPAASENPEIRGLIGDKPTLVLLNKSSLADPAATALWIRHFKNTRSGAVAIDCITGEGIGSISPAVKTILRAKLQRYEEKGMSGKKIRAMIVGIPNVGKSSLVNKLSGAKKAKVEDRPGVTLNKQWVSTTIGIELLDMPGVLWPKFDDRLTGENLALTGAIKDAILDVEEMGCILVKRLYEICPDALSSRYKLTADDLSVMSNARRDDMSILSDGESLEGPYELLNIIGKKRGFRISGGETDTLRTANMLLDEFRGGRIGRISLERP
jgi:ribosome biogenesis GTPase A